MQNLRARAAHSGEAGRIADIGGGEQPAKGIGDGIEFELAQPEIELPCNRRVAIFDCGGVFPEDAPLLGKRLLTTKMDNAYNIGAWLPDKRSS